MIRLPLPPMPMGARKGKRTPDPAPARFEDVIREPSAIVGQSGKVYTTLSENGAELIRVIPIGEPFAPQREQGVQQAATGAELLSLAGTPDAGDVSDPNSLAFKVANGQIGYGTNIGSVQAPARPQVPQVSSSYAPAPAAPQGNFGAAGTAMYNANQAVQTAGQNVVDASGRVIPYQQQQLYAARNATEASRRATMSAGEALNASQAYLDEQGRANMRSREEEEALQAAAANDPDKFAIAQAKRARSSEDYRYGVAGLDLPEEVSVTDSSLNLPPGVRAKFETQEELTQRKNANQKALRDFELESGRINTAKVAGRAQAAGNEATMAGYDATMAGYDVDQAELGVSQARLGVDQAQLNNTRAQTAPLGQVYDADTGTFTTQGQLDMANAGRTIVRDPTTNQMVTQADLLSRTDKDGNVRRADGVWVDPNTKNEFVNGRWIDPETGNVYGVDPLTGRPAWTSPQGLVLRNERWWTPDGYFLQTDGSFYNPVTGETRTNAGNFQSTGGYIQESQRAAESYQGNLNSPDGIATELYGVLYRDLNDQQRPLVDAEYFRRRPQQPEVVDPAVAAFYARYGINPDGSAGGGQTPVPQPEVPPGTNSSASSSLP